MTTTGMYDRPLSRRYPGLFVILLDQSASMKQKDEERRVEKVDIVTTYVNKIIQRMITFAERDEFTAQRKNYAYLSILGYNDNVYPLLRTTDDPVDLVTLDESPRGLQSVEYVVREHGRERVIKGKEPFWVTPKAEGNTQMGKAFERAQRVVEKWLASEPTLISKELGMQAPRNECFPPIIINITDAKHNGDGNPDDVASNIRNLSTKNGHVLIFNCHFTHEKSETCIFPRTAEEIERFCATNIDRKLAQQMFDMSSPMPETLRIRAIKRMERPIQRDAHCFVYNANPEILLQFLTWSTLGAARR